MPVQPKNPKKTLAVELRKQGMTYSAIAKQLDVKEGSVAGWVGMAKRKELAKQAKQASLDHNSASLSPQPPQTLNIQTPILETGAVNKIPMSEQALREAAFKILADGLNGKHVPKTKREWADKIIKSTSKEKVSVSKGNGTNVKTVYATMQDKELAERLIASACALVGGPGADGIIMRLKDEGQWNL